MVKFHNATDSEGNIINIADVKKGHRAKQYYCVGCGKDMSAVLGEKREHHFRHKEAVCSWESYLHKLGKKFLIIGFYKIIMLVFMCLDSNDYENEYGESPKYISSEE